MSSNDHTRKQRREAAREERRAQEAAAAAAAVRKRRLLQFGGVIAAAIIVVVVAIVASGGKEKAKAGAGEVVAGQKDVAAMLEGIPQKGITLGKEDAPMTLVEFADLQCPVCKDFSDNYLPRIIEDHVRTGKLKIVFRNLTFIGADSVKAAGVAAAAGKQDRLWSYVELLYRNQGQENTGWASDDLLEKVAKGAGQINWSQVLKDRSGADATAQLGAANSQATKYGVDATPTFLMGKSEDDLKRVEGDYRTLNDKIKAAVK